MSDLPFAVSNLAAAEAIARHSLGELAELVCCETPPEALYGKVYGAEPRFYFFLVNPNRIGSSPCYPVSKLTGEFRSEGARGE